MSFEEKINALAEKVPTLIDHLETEEATKNALVMPFINALSYDIFNPQEVVPEFVADVGTKKGEKVDYAIMKDGDVIILIECKATKTNLCDANMSQLYRYFAVTKSRIAILTNGINYQFYSDLEEPNKMDARPFLELDMRNLRKNLLAEIRKLGKERFDLDRMLSTANELKYTSQIKKIISRKFEDPDENFVRYFFNAVTPAGSRFTSAAKQEFTEFVKKAASQFINEKVSDFLDSVKAVQKEAEAADEDQAEEERSDGIETTEDELEAYQIVRAVFSQKVDPGRIAHRDTKSYFGVLLDDNNRKPLCRFRFNTSQKYICLIDEKKNEVKKPIDKVTEIFKFSQDLLKTLSFYD
ncbi:MAG: type I restriction enzyme HsdR N-terminal domain-containing protein [Deltaproteobacteria bacterium]|nr:type I restriction enzyme HsdR N-terminal domain-containing protein [Deltaproteobacteria bacterium]